MKWYFSHEACEKNRVMGTLFTIDVIHFYRIFDLELSSL